MAAPYGGLNEDGTYADLSDGDEDTTSNPQAIVPYVVQPDPVVSQRAVVPYAERTVVTSATTLHNARLNTARYGRRNNPATSSVQHREDGVVVGLDSDNKEYDNAHFDSAGDQQDFNAVVNAGHVVHHSDDDGSIDDEAPTQSREIQGSNPSSDALVINDAPFHQRSRAVMDALRRDRERKERDEGVSDSNDEPLGDNTQIIVYDAPQDAPQDDPQDDPQGNHDLNREVQVNPQPSPALSHQAATSNDEPNDVNEHEIDK